MILKANLSLSTLKRTLSLNTQENLKTKDPKGGFTLSLITLERTLLINDHTEENPLRISLSFLSKNEINLR